ncbi:60S ribosomal protein L13 [Quaeritorhiza haematococci]|nr:60S ribosomal protein L13 [Quaeritorhiza haematococci]
MRHNNQLPNQHFRKDWQLRVKTWFDQPGRKKRRRVNRIKRAATIAPRPIDGLLRPAVRCPTIKYNTKLRAGRGFTLAELKVIVVVWLAQCVESGIRRKEALTIGIAVDHRRKNRSVEHMQANVQRLKEYKARLIVFPKKANKPKKGDADAATVATATQFTGPIIPITQDKQAISEAKISGPVKVAAYRTLRIARSDKRLKGVREIRAKEKAEEEAQKKK